MPPKEKKCRKFEKYNHKNSFCRLMAALCNGLILLFLDEFDAIAKKRDDAHELGELKRVVTTLLQNMDAMGGNVFLIAATNHHHLLDPAIWRRFNTSIFLDLPDVAQREEIITKFWKEILSSYKLDMKTLVALTEGTSGAQINNFLQSLAKNCIMHNKERSIDKKDIVNTWLKQSTLFKAIAQCRHKAAK